MGKGFLEDIAPFAAMAAIPALAPGAAGVAGSGILGTTPYAAPAMGAFGSANMLAAGAAGLPATGALASGATALPGTIESVKGLDFINGVPQNFGAGVESLLGNFTDSFSPDSLLKMGMPQQPNQRPAAIMNQIKPVGRMDPRENTPSEPLYNQGNIGARQQLSPEEEQQLKMILAMRGRA